MVLKNKGKKVAEDASDNAIVKRALQDSVSAANDALTKITRIYNSVKTNELDEEGRKLLKRINDMMLGLVNLEGRIR